MYSCSSTYHTAAHALVQSLFLCRSGISMFLGFSATPRGASDPSPRRCLFKAPARRVGHRRPFFRRGLRRLLCGSGVDPPRGRGRPSGARESQVFFGYVIPGNKNFLKDPFGHHYYYYHYHYQVTRVHYSTALPQYSRKKKHSKTAVYDNI